ncbi:MAG: hypothetical protein MJ211_11815 [Bacteroidales bacterium]|nr:hypothetical protein [Bacteroidales bacterium]
MEEFYFLLVIVAIGAYIYLIYKNIIKIKTEIDIFKEYIKNENVIEEEIEKEKNNEIITNPTKKYISQIKQVLKHLKKNISLIATTGIIYFYFSIDNWTTNWISIAIIICSVSLFFISINLNNIIKTPYRENYKEIKKNDQILCQYKAIKLTTLLTAIICIMILINCNGLLYLMGNRVFGSETQNIETQITKKEYISNKSRDKYYIYFTNVNIPQNWTTPKVSTSNKICLDILEKITIQYWLNENKKVVYPEKINTDRKTFDNAQNDEKFFISLKQGYYKTIYQTGYYLY